MDQILLSMTKIPSDEILESLYKLRIRESDQLKTVLELCDMEINQKISVPNHQKLKTMVKRRKDQKLRLRNFDARHGRIETGEVVKNPKVRLSQNTLPPHLLSQTHHEVKCVEEEKYPRQK